LAQAKQRVSTYRRSRLAVWDQSLAPHGARFAVARDGQRDDPDSQRRGIRECRL